ncbi:MAG: glycosyltransferase family 2 protein [Nitrososphaerota archaeon]|jgi:cellulose synthase/poly-beta-1,6-N-acetylglucosamine synthase-like glycosyltransferase|nr:glycosyltransferase family 2 protein [Nitrososphaerota archaeon]
MLVIFEIISIALLTVLLFWSVYNVSIIYVGIRNKRKIQTAPVSSNPVQELPTFSIIVPTKNEESVIHRCLNGIMNIDYPKDKLQVIVVDGNSADNTFAICEEFKQQYPDNITVIREQTTSGKPAALNLALTYATGDIVAVFDADSLPEKNVLSKVSFYFNDKQITAVQGMTTSINEKSNILTRVISAEEKAWFQMLMSGREKMRLFVPLNGSCQFIRHSVLTEMGGWDENSLTEDVELALRLVEKNHLIKYAPDVCSGQETPTALRSLVKQRVRWYRGYMETALKYGRLLEHISKRTIDAEISLAGPFMMVVSLLSYLNWFLVALFFSQSTPVLNFTGLVIALTAVSLVSVGIGLVTSEKPIKPQNILWIPCVYVYWLVQMFIAGWAFLKLVFRSKRDWTKTAKTGVAAPGDPSKKNRFF